MRKRGDVKRAYLLLAIAGCLVAGIPGCDADRLATLERENTDLKRKIDEQNTAMNYDLQAKCSKDARAWFNLNFTPRDKNTIFLDYSNHYNKKLNACFIMVEYHLNMPPTSNWHNMLSLWNVYENNQYGQFDEGHYYNLQDIGDHPKVNDCIVAGTKCTNEDGFNKLMWTYMND